MNPELADGRAKLTYQDKCVIRERYLNRRTTGDTVKRIAADFGMNRHHISEVARRFQPVANENAPAT